MSFALCALSDCKTVKLIKNVLSTQHQPGAFFLLVKY